jgi:hypothetical protein
VPLPVLTMLLLMVICVLTYHSIRQLYLPTDKAEERTTAVPGGAEFSGVPKQMGETA